MWTTGSKLNEALYANPAYDALLGESLAATGLERYKKLAQAEELLLDEAVVLPIDHIAAFNLIDGESIAGWYPNPLDIHPLKYIEIKKEKLNRWVVRLESTTPESSLGRSGRRAGRDWSNRLGRLDRINGRLFHTGVSEIPFD